jgi:hypothetical protein
VGDVALAEPLRIEIPEEEMTQGYIEIIDIASDRRVVTVIEVLSPPNKVPGPGQDLYRRKQQECKEGGVNLVEIDLLRSGPCVLAVHESFVPPSHRTTYRACLFRAGAPWIAEVYRAPLRERLPAIRIPLRSTDQDVPLDLQALIDQCYRNGGYDEDIDYQRELDPPLAADDAGWAHELVNAQGQVAEATPAKGKKAPSRRKRKGEN